jgi:hypothetical protein
VFASAESVASESLCRTVNWRKISYLLSNLKLSLLTCKPSMYGHYMSRTGFKITAAPLSLFVSPKVRSRLGHGDEKKYEGNSKDESSSAAIITLNGS